MSPKGALYGGYYRTFGKTTTLNAIKTILENNGYSVFSLSFEDLGQNLYSSDEKFCAAVLWLMKDAVENNEVCELSEKSRDLILHSSPSALMILSAKIEKRECFCHGNTF